MALTGLKFGARVKSKAVERYKGAKGVSDVIAILSLDIASAHVHYGEGVGYFYCFGGVCCEALGLPATKYIIPVAHYTRRSRDDWGGPVTVKYLSLGTEMYESGLVAKNDILNRDGKQLTDVDLQVTCTDEQYQRISFDVLCDAKWRADTSLVPAVQRLYTEYQSLIGLSVAREITPEHFLAQYEGNKTAANGGVQQAAAALPAGNGGGGELPVPVQEGEKEEEDGINFDNLLV